MSSKALVLTGVDFSTNKIETDTFGTSIPCTGITLDQSTKAVTSMSAFALVATPTPSNTTDEVTWSTSDATVATVVSGVVTPLKLGTVTITVTCGNYSASCAVTIDNVVVPFKAVAGYSPFRRSSTGSALSTDKKTGENSAYFIIAADQATGLYTIESKTDVDTSPYRFVPIIIPNGATKIIVNTTIGRIKTRILYTDSTKMQTQYDTGIGAFCVEGLATTWDQGSTANGPLTLEIPDNVDGLDSFCITISCNNSRASGSDCTNDFTLAFSYGT